MKNLIFWPYFKSIFALSASIFEICSTPTAASFTVSNPKILGLKIKVLNLNSEGYEFLEVINNIIDFTFLLDIFLTFRKTYTDPFTGDEQFDIKKIRKNYLKGNFWIDFFSTVPFEKVAKLFLDANNTNIKKFTVISCLKLIRILAKDS